MRTPRGLKTLKYRRDQVLKGFDTSSYGLGTLLCEAAAELEAEADPLVAVVTHWGGIARLTDCEVLNCTAVFMEWSRADGTAAEGGTRLGRSPQVAAELGWRYVVTEQLTPYEINDKG